MFPVILVESADSPVFKTNKSFFLPVLSLPPKMMILDPTAHIPKAALGVGHPIKAGDSFSHVQFSKSDIPNMKISPRLKAK